MQGRYEKHNSRTNEHKFYELIPTSDPRMTVVAWGRVGTAGSCQLVTTQEATDRIHKKERDGYVYQYSNVESAKGKAMAYSYNQPTAAVNTKDIPVSEPVEEAPKKEEFSISDWITR